MGSGFESQPRYDTTESFLISSMAELLPVKEMVAGSSPASGAVGSEVNGAIRLRCTEAEERRERIDLGTFRGTT